jgi:hypothetical protein
MTKVIWTSSNYCSDPFSCFQVLLAVYYSVQCELKYAGVDLQQEHVLAYNNSYAELQR